MSGASAPVCQNAVTDTPLERSSAPLAPRGSTRTPHASPRSATLSCALKRSIARVQTGGGWQTEDRQNDARPPPLHVRAAGSVASGAVSERQRARRVVSARQHAGQLASTRDAACGNSEAAARCRGAPWTAACGVPRGCCAGCGSCRSARQPRPAFAGRLGRRVAGAAAPLPAAPPGRRAGVRGRRQLVGRRRRVSDAAAGHRSCSLASRRSGRRFRYRRRRAARVARRRLARPAASAAAEPLRAVRRRAARRRAAALVHGAAGAAAPLRLRRARRGPAPPAGAAGRAGARGRRAAPLRRKNGRREGAGRAQGAPRPLRTPGAAHARRCASPRGHAVIHGSAAATAHGKAPSRLSAQT